MRYSLKKNKDFRKTSTFYLIFIPFFASSFLVFHQLFNNIIENEVSSQFNASIGLEKPVRLAYPWNSKIEPIISLESYQNCIPLRVKPFFVQKINQAV